MSRLACRRSRPRSTADQSCASSRPRCAPFPPQRRNLGRVVGDAGGPDSRAALDGLEGSTLPADDGRGPARPGSRLFHRGCRLAAHRRVEQLAALLDRRFVVGRVNRPGVGNIAPGDPPVGVTRPRRACRRFRARGGTRRDRPRLWRIDPAVARVGGVRRRRRGFASPRCRRRGVRRSRVSPAG